MSLRFRIIRWFWSCAGSLRRSAEMRATITLFFTLLLATSLADESVKLREALGSIVSGSYLREFDGQDELPERLKHMSFRFESRKQGFRDARALLNAGIDPNGNATSQETFLTWCAVGGGADAIALLLSYEADPNQTAPVREKWLPINQAAKQSYLPSHLRSVDVLLQGGADPEKQDARGRTALMSAAENGAFQGVNLLLKNGADPDARSNSPLHYTSWTALMFAASRGNPRSAHALLHGGADPKLENSKGETALSLALANKHHQTAGVITRHLNQAEQGVVPNP